jgi:hypothetical protein
MGEEIGDVVELVGVHAALFIRDALGCDPVVCGVEHAVAADGPWKESVVLFGDLKEKGIE